MIQLDLSRYQYIDRKTITVEGKRFYELDDGLAYPSITTTLGHTLPPEDQGWLAAWKARVGEQEAARKSKAATDRGTAVHLMLERYVRGEDVQASRHDPEHVKVFNSLRTALGKVNRVVGQEVVLYSHALQVAGRCDMVGEHEGELAIIDYKTSTRPKHADGIHDYWLQATFYALAHNEMYGTDISKLVIMMGVENKLPMVFKKRITEDLIIDLATRVGEFYDELLK